MAATADPRFEHTIALVGGGIGGLCTAIALLDRGLPIHVYEAAPAFAEIGAGVSLGPNAVEALRRISPATFRAFHKCATYNGSEEHKNCFFTFRNGEDRSTRHGSVILNLESSTGAQNVHRAKLLDELIKHVPEEVTSFNKRLDDIEDMEDHVILHFKDGTSARHAAVICIDGIKSTGRRVLLGTSGPTSLAKFSGKYAYRGLIPMGRATELLGAEVAQNAQMWLGHGAHILTFPVEEGRTMNVVACGSADRWEDERWIKETSKEDMYADFGETWVEGVHDILELMPKPDLWGLFEFPDAETYTKGLICLSGDSAHASTPHHGAGAGMAIEDALVMGELLAEVEKTPAGLRTAFRAFDHVRRPRTQRLVRESNEMGRMYDMMLDGVGDDIDKIRENLQTRWAWIWYEDLDRQVAQAKAMLASPKGAS